MGDVPQQMQCIGLSNGTDMVATFPGQLYSVGILSLSIKGPTQCLAFHAPGAPLDSYAIDRTRVGNNDTSPYGDPGVVLAPGQNSYVVWVGQTTGLWVANFLYKQLR